VRGLLAALLLLAAPALAEPSPFQRGTWHSLRAAHAGQPLVVHLWGLTCAPCLTELPHWAALLRERRGVDVVLIAADPVPQDPARVAATLTRAGLSTVQSWMFTDRFNERLRFEIDPRWRGELPRTLLIAADGAITVMAGVADLAAVREWLDTAARAP